MCIACAWARYLTVVPTKEINIGTSSRRSLFKKGAAAGAIIVAPVCEAVEAQAQPPASTSTADVLFRNGAIYTVNPLAPWAEALVVRGERLLHVGSEAEARRLAGPNARVVDLAGRMLLPGFVEGHIHPLVGSTIARGIDLQFDSRDEILAALRSHAATDTGSGPVRGFGWRYSAFPATGPRREDLDAIWPDRPVFLIAIDGHSAWVNSKALSLAGVTRQTPDPIPGFSIFQRDEAGDATGFLVEVPALMQVLMAAAPLTFDYIASALNEWLPKASRAGITTLFDAGMQVVPEDAGFGLYTQLEKEGRLPFRVVGSCYHNNPAVDPLPAIGELRRKFRTELVNASVLKLNMDGVDASYTAAMLAPYSDKPSTSGQSILSADQVKDIVRRADAEGIDIHVHSIGDRSTRMTLDAVEHAIATNPARDRRNVIAHLQLVSPQDIPRFKELGVIGEFSPQWAVPDIYWRNVTMKRWGQERATQTYPVGTMLRAGIRISFGTDWPAASNYSTFRPLEAIEIAVTRCELGKLGQAPLPPETSRISLAEAIHANTMGGAYQLRMEDTVGSLEAGKAADLIVLDQNLFEASVERIHDVKVVMTMMNGVVRQGSF